MTEHLALKEADKIEVTTIIDNYVDVLLGNTDIVSRPPHAVEGEIAADTLLGEHGLSLLVTVYGGGGGHTVLFDTGYSKEGVIHNISYLGLSLDGVEAIILSHGHMDHTGSFYLLLDKMRKPMPVLVHPFAFTFPRYITRKDGGKDRLPKTLDREEIKKQGAEIVETANPTLVAGDMIAVSGEVERTTSFEKGMPNAVLERNGKMVKDPISDDQALYIRLKGKGLVVVGGCSHAGIINTVLYGKKITGEYRLHAVMGGFHLSGPLYEPILDTTIDALREMNPEVIVPMHCTGWKAIERFSKAFPSSFILNSVGSRFTFSSS